MGFGLAGPSPAASRSGRRRRRGRSRTSSRSVGGYVHVGDPYLTAGTHTFTLTYPHSDLTPGSGDNSLTSLSAIALQPQSPPSRLVTVAPEQAGQLCGEPLDWIEIVPAG